MCLPYIQGFSESVEKAVRDINIRTVFKTTLSHIEMMPDEGQTPTDPINTKGVIYKIPCECTKVYVGETGRTMKQRISEHKRAVKNGDTNNGLAVHVAGTGHSIKWDEAEIVCRDNQWTKRKIKESLAIKAHADNLNSLDPLLTTTSCVPILRDSCAHSNTLLYSPFHCLSHNI